jgi:acyl carrier protein/ribosomal protein S18 acetylase RimI-like enzyme
MNRTEIENQVRNVLRRSSFVAGDRKIGMSDPLGEVGTSDSLALVELVAAFEVEFQTELPETIWTDRKELTLQRIVDAIADSDPIEKKKKKVIAPPLVTSTIGSAASESEKADSKVLKVVRAIKERGLIGGGAWVLTRFAGRLKRFVYRRDNQVLLEFDLAGSELPSHSSSLDLTIRDANDTDIPAIRSFFGTFERHMDDEFLRDRLHNGFTCFMAIHNGEFVGMSWNSAEGEDNCPFTGLDFKMLPGSCYALDLYEHRGHRGKGIGLALLCHGLAEAKARGFQKQVTSVDVTNTRMLTASIHMSGFVKVGTVQTTWLFQRPLSRWSIGTRSGRGGAVVL